MFRVRAALIAAGVAISVTSCVRVDAPALEPRGAEPEASLWEAPTDLSERDLFYGPWGSERAPVPDAIYTLVERKHTGTNPGMTVRDPLGREWSVKQAVPGGLDDEGRVEVAVSRLLSAIGYHQPPDTFFQRSR